MRPPHLPDIIRKTGRIRFTRGWLGRVRVQLEVNYYQRPLPMPPGKEPRKEKFLYVGWQDADKADMEYVSRFLYQPQSFPAPEPEKESTSKFPGTVDFVRRPH